MSQPVPQENMENQTIWTFACEHRFRTCPTPKAGFRKDASPLACSSTEACPTCKAEAIARQEAATEQGLKDSQALAIWKKQKSEIEAHIRDAKASNDVDMVVELKTMLKMCNTMWAKKVFKMEEKRSEMTEEKEWHVLRDLDAAIKTLVERIDALVEADNVLNGGKTELVEDTNLSFRNLIQLKDDLDTLVGTFDQKVRRPLARIENALREYELEIVRNLKEQPKNRDQLGEIN